jgi:hypothetical protein
MLFRPMFIEVAEEKRRFKKGVASQKALSRAAVSAPAFAAAIGTMMRRTLVCPTVTTPLTRTRIATTITVRAAQRLPLSYNSVGGLSYGDW